MRLQVFLVKSLPMLLNFQFALTHNPITADTSGICKEIKIDYI